MFITTPTPIPIPLPVAFGPHEADWWMVVVTFIGATASVVVAISALVTSRRAQATAVATEKARVKAEQEQERSRTKAEAARTDWEYQLRFEDALVGFMTDVGKYLEQLAQARRQGEMRPSTDPLLASLEVVRVRARREEDHLTMDRVRRVLSVAHRTKDDVAFRSMFTALLKHLRWVRDGTISSDEFDDWVSELEQQSAERRSAE